MTAWPGWTAEDTLILPLEDTPPTQAVVIDGRRYEPKGELHVTLVGSTLGRELRDTLGSRLDAATRPAFEALDWSVARSGRGAVLAATGALDAGGRGAVGSVVEFVDVPALAHFRRWLGELLGRQLPVPPAHVTLYTAGRARGIGIPTPAALRRMQRARIELAALRPA